MTYFPDVRTDEAYNQKKLNDKNKKFVEGYDWCTDTIKSFFASIGDSDEYLDHILMEKVPEDMADEEVSTYADLLRFRLENWIESSRDELVVAMLDHPCTEGDEPKE